MHERHGSIGHTAVACRQIVEHFLDVALLLLQIIRNSRRKVIVGVLTALPVGDIGFNTEQTAFSLLDRFVDRDRDDIDRKHDIAVQRGQIGEDRILDVGAVFSQEKHTAVTIADFEMVALKLKGIGSDIILEAVTSAAVRLDIEIKVGFFADTIKVVKKSQALGYIHLGANAAELFQTSGNLSSCTIEVGAGFFNGLFEYEQREILILYHRVRAGRLIEEHTVILMTAIIQSVILIRQEQRAFDIETVDPAVVDGDLCRNTRIKSAEKICVLLKHILLIVVVGDSIVNVGKLECFRKQFSADLKDTVIVDALDRDRVLTGLRGDKSLTVLLFHT